MEPDNIIKKKKTENKKEYMKEYMQKHPLLWNRQETCEICNKKFMISNKSNHMRSTMHKYAVIAKENELLKLQLNKK